MRYSILAFAFVVGAANLAAQGQPMGGPPMMRQPGPGPAGPDDPLRAPFSLPRW